MKFFNHTIYAPTKIDRHDKTSALSAPSVVDTYQYSYRVNIYSGSESAWTLEKQTTFTYDGWNLIQEVEASVYDSSNSAFTQFRTSNYTWGLDLSQTLQGAGGVGGLLSLSIPNSVFTQFRTSNYTHDANVSELIAENGSIAAHYEYSPFGKVVHKSGPLADKNPFQFSTKYLDNETQLYYYGLRHYNPESGRWINRDPIGENGGINIFSFVSNDSVNWIDILGLNLYAIDGTYSTSEDNHNTKKFFDRSNESGGYWEGPNAGVTGLDASGIFRGVKKKICSDYCADKNIKINLVGWSRGATIAMEITEELQDDGCCCQRNWIGWCCDKQYPKINWLGLFNAVDMTLTWGWANNITSNVQNASHVVKSEKQLIFPTSSAEAENPKKTKLNTVTLENSNHSDVGATSEVALSWMVDEAIKAGVDVNPLPKNWNVK